MKAMEEKRLFKRKTKKPPQDNPIASLSSLQYTRFFHLDKEQEVKDQYPIPSYRGRMQQKGRGSNLLNHFPQVRPEPIHNEKMPCHTKSYQLQYED
jgi:hypothetical protein